jgi:hypothetical protein
MFPSHQSCACSANAHDSVYLYLPNCKAYEADTAAQAKKALH